MSNYKLCFYVPADACDAVKAAVFAAGAGRIGDYDQCAWQTEGIGQFRPLSGSKPSIGVHDKLETVKEIKVEMVCQAADLDEVIQALKQAHPYEEPAFDVWQLAGY